MLSAMEVNASFLGCHDSLRGLLLPGTEQSLNNEIGGIIFCKAATHQGLKLFGVDVTNGGLVGDMSLGITYLSSC